MRISKMQTYLRDKMPLKNEKQWDLAKLENSFLILTFWGGILSPRQHCFFEISIQFLIFDTLYDLFQEKKISALKRPDFKINQHKNRKKVETPQNKEKCLS